MVYLLVDKDYKNALYSLGSSVSFGAGKLVAWAGKGSKTALRIQRVCNFAGSAINFAQSAEGTVNMGGMMIDKYIIQGQPFDDSTAMEFLFLGANIFGATKSGAAIATDVRDFGKFAKGSWTKGGIPYLAGNNSGFVDGDALKDVFKGKSGKTSSPYANLKDSKFVGEGKKFTSTQKKNIIQQNMERNGGVIKSDLSGEILVPATQNKKGVTPNPFEVQIDHIDPRSKGGSNSYSNAQVLSRTENIKKSNK